MRSIAPLRSIASLLALIVISSGCATTRERVGFSVLDGLLRYRHEETAAYFSDTYRTTSLYAHFRPVLIVDAIAMDRAYRQRFVQAIGRQYLLEKGQIRDMQETHDQAFNQWFELIIFVYEGEYATSRLDKRQSVWRLYLRDDEGAMLSPIQIKRLKKGDPHYLWLKTHFAGVDRWSEVYRLRFTKLAKGLLGKSIGDLPFQLIITGVRGTAKLQWDDPATFYHSATRSEQAQSEKARSQQTQLQPIGRQRFTPIRSSVADLMQPF